ncbi:hypothetical protein [Amycolatopsis sp. BJA-103]|uniref:hypothetical protein n=1 Tax=Amycolatopsis sp. BJA-103 TaxID=1911175 RepID=UPI0030032115
MKPAEVVADGFGRVQEVVHEAVEGLDAGQLVASRSPASAKPTSTGSSTTRGIRPSPSGFAWSACFPTTSSTPGRPRTSGGSYSAIRRRGAAPRRTTGAPRAETLVA